MKNIDQAIKTYLETHGRPLEKAKYNYFFNQGTKVDIIEALKEFQNKDGGFGHALEPDFTTEESNPIDTWTAIKTLRLLDLAKTHPLIKLTLRYLENCPYKKDGYYFYAIPSNNDSPHAPWWHHDKTRTIQGYNPSASLVGFILKYEPKGTTLFNQTFEFYNQMIEDFINNPTDEVHELKCFVELYHDIKTLFDVTKFEETLKKQITKTINPDSKAWFNSYTPKPSDLIISPTTPGYEEIKDLVALENKLLLKHINDEGVWDITWEWNQYEEDFLKAKRAWKSILAFNYYNHINHFKDQ